MWRFDRKQQNSVKQLSFDKKLIKKRKNTFKKFKNKLAKYFRKHLSGQQ